MENKREILNRLGIGSSLKKSCKCLLGNGLQGKAILCRKGMLEAVGG